MGEGWDNRDPHKTGSTGTFRAETRGGRPSKTGTPALTQDAPSKRICANKRSIGRLRHRRSDQGAGRRRENGPRHPDANTTGPDRRGTDRTGRANGGADAGVADTTFRPHSRAHLLVDSCFLSALLLLQTIGDRREDPLQDSRTGANFLTSGILTNTCKCRHGYPRDTGSFR